VPLGSAGGQRTAAPVGFRLRRRAPSAARPLDSAFPLPCCNAGLARRRAARLGPHAQLRARDPRHHEGQRRCRSAARHRHRRAALAPRVREARRRRPRWSTPSTT
jgi:hypothetical protein